MRSHGFNLSAALCLLSALAMPGPAPASGKAQAMEALAEFEASCSKAEPLWPAELCGRVILVDPRTRIAVANRPDPEGQFSRQDGQFVGEWPAGKGVANTAIEWEGEMWAMAMLPLPDDRFARLKLLAHESFHRIQPELGHEIADPMAPHLDEKQGRIWLRLELRALARALAGDDDDARDAAEDALLFRQIRHVAFPDASAVERKHEAHEGLAEYTGARFALDVTDAGVEKVARQVAAFEDRPTFVRSHGYGTGPALGLLLDRYAPGWRDALGTAPDLAQLLATALEVIETDPDATPRRELALRRAADYGFDEVQAEEAERADRLAADRARYRQTLVDGPVLELELPDRQLMFNPSTVVSLGDDGDVYPGSILQGPWGRLTLHEGAALAPAGRDRARVAADQSLEPDDERVVQGPGWRLELEPGWRIASGTRSGDFRLTRGTGR